MTALCGGGPSESRPGFDGGVYLGAKGISLILKALVPEPVAEAIAAIVSADAIDLTTFCTTDPPPMPTPGPEDFVALLNPGDFVEYQRVRALFIQWWEHIYWYNACQCTNVATPPLGPVTQPPPGGQNSGLPGGGFSPCYESTVSYSAVGSSSGTPGVDLTNVWLPASPDRKAVSVDLGFGPINLSATRIPSGVTTYWFKTHNRGAASPTADNAFDGVIRFYDANGVDIDGHQFLSSQDVDITLQASGFPVLSNAVYAAIGAVNRFDTSVAGKVMSWEVDFQFRCAGSALDVPCCPPDPMLELKLDQMFQLLVNLNQAAPASAIGGWTDGPRHNALEKAGSFLIAKGTIGIRFEFTTIPIGFQVSPGNPNFYWDLGFWSPYALGSPMRGARLVYNPESFHLPDFTDQIGYTLASGVIANAVELIPATP